MTDFQKLIVDYATAKSQQDFMDDQGTPDEMRNVYPTIAERAAVNLKTLMDAINGLQSAVRTLEHLGYTNHGGEYWQPPIGKAPKTPAPPTDEQVHLGQWDDGSGSSADFREGVRFAERKHGIHAAKGGQHGDA